MPTAKVNGKDEMDIPAAIHLHQGPELLGADSIIDDMAGTRSTPYDQEVLQVMLRVATGQERIIAQQDKALAQQDLLIRAIADGKNGSGNGGWLKNWAPVIMSGLLLIGTVIRYDATRETTTGMTTHELQGAVSKLEERVGKMETWDEKVRSNLAANGWLVDRETGEVKRVKVR